MQDRTSSFLVTPRSIIKAAVFALALLLVFAGLAKAAGSISSGPNAGNIGQTTATVSWGTDFEGSSIVQYGTTSALGLEQRDIVFIAPGEDEDKMSFSHAVTLQELTPGTRYFYRAKSDTNPSTTNDGDAAFSATKEFTTQASTPSCTADTWDCTAYGQCQANGTQTRVCTLTTDCPTAATPKPAESQSCTPSCTADVWDCTAYGQCQTNGTQTRACTLKTDCPTASTPKPAESQSCTPSCTADVWDCTAYSACRTDGTQSRACTLKTDCPTATTPKPTETQSCTPSCSADVWDCTEYSACRTDGTQSRACTLKTDCPTATTPKPTETQSCNPSCTADVWDCTDYNQCGADGTQTRACTLKTDCPTATTPKPVESQKCTPSFTGHELLAVKVTSPAAGSTVASPFDGRVSVEGDADVLTVYFNPKELQVEKQVQWTAKKSSDEGNNENWDFSGVTLAPGEWTVYAEAKGKDATGKETVKTSPKLGYGIIVVGGEGDAINIQGFVVNSHSSALDLSVFGFSPQEIKVEAMVFLLDSQVNPGDTVRCTGTRVTIDGREAFSCEMKQPAGEYSVVAEGSGTDKDGKQITFFSPPLAITLTEPPPPLTSAAIADLVPTSLPQDQLSAELTQRILDWSAVRSSVEDFEKNTEAVSGGFGLIGATPQTQVELAKECRDGGIDASRCDEWLKVRYADKSCQDAGVFSRESCVRFLEDKNGGVFPGCEGKAADECRRIRDVATLGYMSDSVKEKTDQVVDQAIKDHVMVLLPDVMSVSDKLVDEVKWYPSAKAEGQETSAGVIVLDFDKDGLPDALETRLGLDWRDMDSDDDGVADSKVPRDVLKSYFEKGDRPTSAQFANLLDSMLKLSSVDRMFILGNPMEQPTGAGDVDETFRVFVIPHVLERSGSILSFAGGDPNNPQCLGNLQPMRVSGNWVCGVTSTGSEGADPNTPTCENGMQQARTDGGLSVCIYTPYVPSQDRRFVDELSNVNYREYDANEPPQPKPNFIQPSDASDPNEAIQPPIDPYGGTGLTSNFVTGHAEPNTTCLIYVYSYVPMVLAVQTDADGNFSYDLSDSVVDGEHTVYVAVTDDTGKITKKSNPLSFLVKEALAVDEADFLRSDVAQTTEPVAELKRYYVLGTIAMVLVAAAIAFGFIMGPRRKPEAKA